MAKGSFRKKKSMPEVSEMDTPPIGPAGPPPSPAKKPSPAPSKSFGINKKDKSPVGKSIFDQEY